MKVTVIPVGGVADSATVPPNPPCVARVIVVVVEDPCVIVKLDGLVLSEKSGGGAVMVTVDVVLVLPVCAASPV